MNHLIFDTETTGFFNPQLELTSRLQSRVVQLAAILLDSEFREIGQMNALIQQDPWVVMNPGAFNAHGISLEKANKEGRPKGAVLDQFTSMCQQAQTLVAHNIEFDSNMLRVECANSVYSSFNHANEVCTMSLMTPICKLPFARRNTKNFKWPKLREAWDYVTKGEPFPGQEHDGLSDCRATARIYKWLWENGYVNDSPTPAPLTLVHSDEQMTTLPENTITVTPPPLESLDKHFTQFRPC